MPRTIPAMRALLYIASVLVFVEGTALFILPGLTSRLFAWTVRPSLTAAYLGAGYLASCVLEVLAARRRRWDEARVAVPAVLAFTALTLVATLIHLSKFHLHSPHPLARAAVWVWLAVYATVPAAMAVILVLQMRSARASARVGGTHRPLPNTLRFALMGIGGAMGLFGAVLFLAPRSVAPVWPWHLTPLTAQAVAAWLIGVGIAAVHAPLENDLTRVRPAMGAFIAFGVLELGALLLESGTVRWADPMSWIVVGCLGFLAGAGAWNLRAGART